MSQSDVIGSTMQCQVRPQGKAGKRTDEISVERFLHRTCRCNFARDGTIYCRVLCSTGSIAFVTVIYVFFPTFRSTLTESIKMPRPNHLLLCIAFVSLISGMSGIELPDDVNWPDE